MKINVKDPQKIISWILCILKTKDIIILHVDLTGKGKRAECTGIRNNKIIFLERNTQIELEKIPFVEYTMSVQTVYKYTIFITIINSKVLERSMNKKENWLYECIR